MDRDERDAVLDEALAAIDAIEDKGWRTDACVDAVRALQAEPAANTGPWGVRSCAAGRLEATTLGKLQREVIRARSKFPRNRLLLAALAEEVGELAKALLQRADRVNVRAEALQVATVALRIFEEGDATFADVTDEEAQP